MSPVTQRPSSTRRPAQALRAWVLRFASLFFPVPRARALRPIRIRRDR
jgi:hypothetical protein